MDILINLEDFLLVELLVSLTEPSRSFVIIALGMAIYFLPAIVANRRKAKHEIGIFWVNFFLGWTVLGWFAVLVWTVAETAPELIPEKCSKSFLGRFVIDVIDRVNRFVPDDKSKGRVQFRAGFNRDSSD